MISNKVFIERLSDGTIINCSYNINDIINAIIKEYHASEVCIEEVMSNLCIHGVSIEDVTVIYAKVYAEIEDDKITILANAKKKNIATDYEYWF